MNWNMPYGLARSGSATAADHVSPLSDILVTTPQSIHEAPSPMAVAVKATTATDRARLFLQARHYDLLQSMEKHQAV